MRERGIEIVEYPKDFNRRNQISSEASTTKTNNNPIQFDQSFFLCSCYMIDNTQVYTNTNKERSLIY